MNKLNTVLSGTFRGLVQRRLWPIALALIAGLVAVPLLLTTEPEPFATSPDPAANVEAEIAAAKPLVAVASESQREGLRRVLGARKDPFKPTNQPKTKKAKRESQPGSGSSGVRAAASGGGSTSVSGGSGQTAGSGGSGYVAPAPLPPTTRPGVSEQRPKLPAGSLTVRWGTAGDSQLERLLVKRLDPLPSTDEPLLVYMGLTKDHRSAVFMIDADLAVDGDGRCRPIPADCQTVELSPGETAFVTVTGEDGTTSEHQLDLVRIHGRRAATRPPSKEAAAEARATSRALRFLGHSAPVYRFDESTGTLEHVDADD